MARLSDLFRHISFFRRSGHQIGRKVGDMLEVLTYAALTNVPEIRKRLAIEPKLFGFSDAGHKVEFAIMKNPVEHYSKEELIEIKDPKQIICFVECKKVGVEQTVGQGFKKKFSISGEGYKVPLNNSIKIPLGSNEHKSADAGYIIHFSLDKKKINLVVSQDEKVVWNKPVIARERYIFCLEESGQKHFIHDSGSLRDLASGVTTCKILEILEVKSDSVICVLNDCLPGPQTPEKAKQSSFVALDVRKLQTNSFDKRPNESEYKSILVITEANHWETKSRNMIRACIDVNLTVDDEIVIEAFIAFELEFGDAYYPYISKENYRVDAKAKKIADKILKKYDQKIFKDLDTGKALRFNWANNQVQLTA